MKKTSVLFVAIMINVVHSASAGSQYYVSPAGNDNNPGSIKKPFKTLTAARDAMRSKSQDGGNDKERIVYLRGGNYRLTQTFELNEKDSNVTYTAYQGEKVSITGGPVIAAKQCVRVKDESVLKRLPEGSRGKVLELDLKQHAIDMSGGFGPRGFSRPYIPADVELFIDGEAMNLARWPDKGEPKIPIHKVIDRGSRPRWGDYSNRGGILGLATDRPKRWTRAKDVWISGLFCHGYADDTVQVKSFDLDKMTLSTVHPHLYGYASGRKWRAWYALNLLEEISVPGEYYVDKKMQKLYFYPPGSFSTKSRFQVSSLKTPMLALEGCSNVKFERITFEASRGMGIYIERGENNRVLGCTLRNIGIVAVCMGKGGRRFAKGKYNSHGDREDKSPVKMLSRELGSIHECIYEDSVFDRDAGKGHGIISCDIYNIGAGAVHMGGGDRKTLTPGGNFIRNCHIHKFNRLGRTYKGAVNIDGVGNRVEFCKINDAPALALYIHGNDHIIEYNEIHDVMEEGDDMGACYLGRDPSEFNNVFRYNYFHHIGRTPLTHHTYAIHLDDMACGTQIYGNIFNETGKNAALQIVGGKYNHVYNNIFVNCPRVVRLGNFGQGGGRGMYKKNGVFEKRTLKAVDITKPPYSEKYPELKNYWQDNPQAPVSPVTGNLAVNSKVMVDREDKPEWGPFTNNLLVDEDPDFVDMAAGNFNLKKTSRAFKEIKGFKPLPKMEKMGLYCDEYRKWIPTKVSLLEGGGFIDKAELISAAAEGEIPLAGGKARVTLDGEAIKSRKVNGYAVIDDVGIMDAHISCRDFTVIGRRHRLEGCQKSILNMI